MLTHAPCTPACPPGFVGNAEFALGDSPPPVASDRDLFVWNWSFCAVATTVMAGSIAERSTFISYCIYAAFFSSWVYPVIAHWSWSPNGWLSAYNANPLMGVGVIDFAGSGGWVLGGQRQGCGTWPWTSHTH